MTVRLEALAADVLSVGIERGSGSSAVGRLVRPPMPMSARSSRDHALDRDLIKVGETRVQITAVNGTVREEEALVVHDFGVTVEHAGRLVHIDHFVTSAREHLAGLRAEIESTERRFPTVKRRRQTKARDLRVNSA